MNDFFNFTSAPIRKLKRLKLGAFRISMTVIFAALAITGILMLCTVSIDDAEATFVRNGDFQLGMTISAFTMFEGDNMNITMFLKNSSAQTQFVAFQGGCQATYKITNMAGETVYPTGIENLPCNNRGYEEFLIYPEQVKNYYFSLVNKADVSPILPVGKYQITGTVEGFGVTDTKTIEVLPRPKTTNGEGELCQGMTGRACDKGLECRYKGGFPGGAGMCFKETDDFEPVNRCQSGAGRCFDDVGNHAARHIIDKFVLLGLVSGYEDGNFKPDEPIQRADFYSLVEKVSGKTVKPKDPGALINREESIVVLYKIFIGNRRLETLEETPFVDTKDSKYKSYLVEAYNLGLIFLNDEKTFRPNAPLTRVEALVLIDRFQNL